uniref:Peroxisomal biogenesis factor 11 n=1 Tax=Physcomitrium patens TaxID=3218 RepID=A0A7I4FJK9_PHYPA
MEWRHERAAAGSEPCSPPFRNSNLASPTNLSLVSLFASLHACCCPLTHLLNLHSTLSGILISLPIAVRDEEGPGGVGVCVLLLRLMCSRLDGRPVLEHLEAYLARRDGVDKALKILRYSTKLLLASPIAPKDPEVYGRLKDFDASVGSSRKAFRLGKFIQDVNVLKKTNFNTRDGFLELVATGGEGFYYFVEQFVWLVKAGLIDKRHSKRLTKISAWAEFIGYFGSVALKSIQVSIYLEQEAKLLQGMRKKAEGGISPVSEIKELQALQGKRLMKTLSIIQDLADSLLALTDIRETKGVLDNPFLLAFAGLLSALISAQKNWKNC